MSTTPPEARDPLGQAILALGAAWGAALALEVPLIVAGLAWSRALLGRWPPVAVAAALLWSAGVVYGAWMVGMIAYSWVNDEELALDPSDIDQEESWPEDLSPGTTSQHDDEPGDAKDL